MKLQDGARGTASRSALRSGPRSALSDPGDTVAARLTALAPHLDGEPDPDFRTATRARLVAMAAVRRPGPEPVSPLRRLFAGRQERTGGRWRTRLAAGLVGAAAAVTALATMVALSADARPGDMLYGVKRGTEQTQLALAGDARGRTLLGFASNRLMELGTVLEGGPDADLVADTLATMNTQTVDGTALVARHAVETGDGAMLDVLAGWTAGQSGGLGSLAPGVPEGARDDLDGAAALLARIDERIHALREALSCPSGPATGGTDDLGPVPAPCLPAVTPPVAGSLSVTGTPLAVPGVSPPGSGPATPPGTGPVTTSAGGPGATSGSGVGGTPGGSDTDAGPATPLPEPAVTTVPGPGGPLDLPESPDLPGIPNLPGIPGLPGITGSPTVPATGSATEPATPSGANPTAGVGPGPAGGSPGQRPRTPPAGIDVCLGPLRLGDC